MSRDELILSLRPVVHRAARSACAIYGGELDDVIEDGWLGAIEAVDRYDEARGVKLATFAAHRINGAILDGLRARDRLTVRHRRAIRAGLAPLPAPALSVEQDQVDGVRVEDLVVDTASTEPDLDVRAEVDRLPPREAQIVYQHYWRERTLTAIAIDHGVTVGRISQIMKESQRTLAKRLPHNAL